MTPRGLAVALTAAVLLVALPAGAEPHRPLDPRGGVTTRVSVSSDGEEALDYQLGPAISADGRHVAFYSEAPNLVADKTTPFEDVYVHDRVTGVTERVSLAHDGSELDAHARDPVLAADGRYVAFISRASNVVPGISNDRWDVYVRDRLTDEVERVSVATDGTETGSWSMAPSISADGRYVTFDSLSSRLVPDDTNQASDVFVRDRETGETRRVSVASDGTQGDRNSCCPAISADGRHVAFVSAAWNLVDDDLNGVNDVFVHDLQTGETERVSVPSDGTDANWHSGSATISADGRHVAFSSAATNLVPQIRNPTLDTFVRDRLLGTTERVTVSSSGGEPTAQSWDPSISADGRYVSFRSSAPNLVPGDDNGRMDVFIHDRLTRTTDLVSLATDGTQGDLNVYAGRLSADGSVVAFETRSSNLVPDKADLFTDIYARVRGPAVAIHDLAAVPQEGGLLVTGRSVHTGAEVSAAAADAQADPQVHPLGGEIRGASVVAQPEEDALLLVAELATMPGFRLDGAAGVIYCDLIGSCPQSIGGAPKVLYGFAFEVAGTGYEARAQRSWQGNPFTEPVHFRLFRCDPDCTAAGALDGGLGTTGTSAVVSVPLSAVDSATTLTGLRAYTALGDIDEPDPRETLDELALPDTDGVEPTLTLTAVDDDGAPVGQSVVQGTGPFATTVQAAPGAATVRAELCLGGACSVAVQAVSG